MDDHLILKIFDSKRNLSQIVSSFDLSDPFPPFDQLIHSLVGAQLQDNVDIDCILEILLVFHYKLWFHRLVYLYFSG